MKLIRTSAYVALLFALAMPAGAKKKNKEQVNDSNTPLHLLQPEYETPYGELSPQQVKADIDRVLHYLEAHTPAVVEDKQTGKEIDDYTALTPNAQLRRGAFRLTSYEWGVTYSAMLAAAKATGDEKYREYVDKRFRFLAEVTPHFRAAWKQYGDTDPLMLQVIDPQALDDAGAVCSAMIKAQLGDKSLKLGELITNYIQYIMYREHRLADGTFARNRPQQNTVWLDDMFMGIPALAWMGRFASDNQDIYFAEAVKQVSQFADRMFVAEKGLYRHGWVESSAPHHPAFFWGRANGWALLAKCEVLDALPNGHPGREKVLHLLQKHIAGIAACQGGNGFWHQLLDRNDSYYETSATAIFAYCIAHAVNKGWIDSVAYAPIAQLAWSAVATQINSQGEVEGTCVGTGMAFDPAFYYHRPVHTHAAHGYGTVIWAGAEVIQMLEKFHPRTNDSAIQYYRTPQINPSALFSVADPVNNPRDIVSGVSRLSPASPVVFLIGDSTVKNGKGAGDGDQWGWGSFFAQFFDTDRITVENHAMGGRSSRTYLTEGLWRKVLPGIKEGDFLFIQFGHNDGGPLNRGRARASLPGAGSESQTVIMERNGAAETVETYGTYIRKYIREAKAKGAHVIVLSHTPGNRWTEEGRVRRVDETYGKWSAQVAAEEGVLFIDLNNCAALKLEALGREKTATLFKDGVHTTREGAILNGETIIEELKKISNNPLKDYLK